MYHLAVVGNPIAHSRSPQIHHAFAREAGLAVRYSRLLCPNDVDSFRAVVQAFFAGGGTGANVTVPFKEMAYHLCDVLSPAAQSAGAVNTLWQQDGKLFGDNTDGKGLVNHINQLGWQLTQAKVLILGAGGAARGVVLPLVMAGVSHIDISNRTLSKAETLVAELTPMLAATNSMGELKSLPLQQCTGHYDVVINATSMGLSAEQTLPFSSQLISDYAYDMMYGKPSAFLQHFSQIGASVSDGLGMLIGQAALSFTIWTGQNLSTQAIQAATQASQH